MNKKYFKIAGLICIGLLVITYLTQKFSNESNLCKGTMIQTYSYFAPNPSVSNPTQSYTVDINVKDFDQAQAKVNHMMAGWGGSIISLHTYKMVDADRMSILAYEIPTQNRQSVLYNLRELGVVRSELISDLDTNHRVFLESSINIPGLKERRDLLLQTYAQETNQWRARQIQEELAQIDQQLQSGAVYSPVEQVQPQTVRFVVCLYEEPFSLSKTFQGVGQGLARGVDLGAKAVVNIVNGLIKIVIYLVPVIVWIGIISLVIFLGVKIWSKPKKTERPPEEIE